MKKKSLMMLICLIIAPVIAFSSTIPPYILDLGRTNVSICWVTDEETQSSIEISSIYGSQVIEEEKNAKFHKIEVDQLRPGTHYAYSVGKIYQGSFVTASLDDSFSVVAFGHPGGSKSITQYPVGLQSQAIKGVDPDIILSTGDLTYHATVPDFYKFFFRPFRDVLREKPIYVSPSNHDSSWPMLYGVDYSTFRELFPRNYASGDGAYYSFTYKHVKFIALSYVAGLKTMDSPQIKWLRSELENSDAEFNIVFMGGAQQGYYDKKMLFDVLGDYRVDLVLGGDGPNVHQERINNINYLFAGTSFQRPHQFYFLEFEKYNFTVKLFDSTGAPMKGFWQFNSSKQKKKVLSLNKPEGVSSDIVTSPFRVQYKSLSIDSEQFDGIALVLDWKNIQHASLTVRWKPLGKKPLLGEGSFRKQPLLVRPVRRNEYLLPMPKKNPYTGQSYTLDEIILKIAELKKFGSKAFLNSISEIYLFKD